MIRAIIFDMDGVIIESEPLWEKACQEQFIKWNITFQNANQYKKFINQHIRGRTEREGIKYTQKKFKLKGSYQKILKERLKILFKIFNQELKPIPGSLPLIKKLHSAGYPLLLASSSPPAVINYVIGKYGLKRFFKKIISGENFKKSKPHPFIYLKSAQWLKVKPANCLVFEDSISGVAAAYRAGMHCIAVKHPYTPYKYLKSADLVVKKLSTITLQVINNL